MVDVEIVQRELVGHIEGAGPPGDPAWRPVLAVVTDDHSAVFEITDWVGGVGTKPATGYFKGDRTLTTDITQALHLAGDATFITEALVEIEDALVTANQVLSDTLATKDSVDASEVQTHLDTETTAADVATVTQLRADSEAFSTTSGLFAAMAQALMAGRVFTTLSDPAIAALDGTPPYGTPFIIQGAANGVVYGELWRRISGANQDQGLGIPSLAQIQADIASISFLNQITVGLQSYLDPTPDEIPLFLYADGSYTKYFKLQADGSWVYISEETARLDRLDRVFPSRTVLQPGFTGRVIQLGDNSTFLGRRTDNDLLQIGLAPAHGKILRAHLSHSVSGIPDGTIIVDGDGIAAPFVIAGRTSSTGVLDFRPASGVANYKPENHGFEAFSWQARGPSGALPLQPQSFLGNFAADLGTLASGVSGIVLVLAIGQSTVNGTLAVPPRTLQCPRTGYITMFDVTPTDPPGSTPRGPRILGNDQGPNRHFERVEASKLRKVVPARESAEASGETPCSQACYELQKRLNVGGDAWATFTANMGIGSTPYSGIGPGTLANNYTDPTVPYQNLMLVGEQIRFIAKVYNLAIKVVILWPWHEGDVDDPLATYSAHIVELQTRVSIDFAKITNNEVTQVPLIMGDLCYATFQPGRTYTEQGLAQVQYAIDPATKFLGAIATPDYTLPRNTVDFVHPTNDGFARMGSYMGRTSYNVLAGNDPLPLHTIPSTVAISGNTVSGTMHLPYGGVAVTTVSPIVSDPGNYGFVLLRVDNGVAVPFTVAVVGLVWTVTVPAPPSGVQLELSHAFRGNLGDHGGPNAGARSPINAGEIDIDSFGNAFSSHLVGQRFFVTFP